MPELPEVETIRRGLAPVMEGERFTRVELRRPNLRFPFPCRFAQRLEGAHVLSLGRRAKYLMAELDTGEVLVMHLGMSGRFTVERPKLPVFEPGRFYDETERRKAHDHAVFHLSSGARIVYNDARRFGFMALVRRDEFEAHPLFQGLGVEPLGNAFSADTLDALFTGKARPLKSALLDQRMIAGLGNIYVCEALFRARLSPTRPAGSIAGKGASAKARRQHLADAIREVLADAIAKGGSTLRDYAGAQGEKGAFQHEFQVYDRESAPCPHAGCRGVIRRIVQAGRSTFYCPVCQK